MLDIKNANGRLVAKLDRHTNTIVIQLRGYETKITHNPDNTYTVVNARLHPIR